MNQYSIYDPATGLFTGVTIFCNPDAIDLNVPEGMQCLIGTYDQLSQKFNMDSGDVVDYQPPQPAPNYIWDVDKKRWVYTKTDDDLAADARAIRDSLLTTSDWRVVQAFETGFPVDTTWAKYRQDLRDISSQSGFPTTIDWPTEPTEGN